VLTQTQINFTKLLPLMLVKILHGNVTHMDM